MVVLCLPLVSVFSVKAEPTSIDFLIYLSYPETQLVVDEIIDSAESVGLVVNPIYIDNWNYFNYLILFTNDWDLYYGGFMNTYMGADDNIFNCAYGNMGYNYYYLRTGDAKYTKFSLQLYNWYLAAMADASIVDDDYINDMYDKFHDCEERLWEHQYLLTLATGYNIGGFLQELILTPNCLPGYAFADENLRLAFSNAIDRTVAVDYLLALGFTNVEIFYHTFGYSVCHDTTLPNCLPA